MLILIHWPVLCVGCDTGSFSRRAHIKTPFEVSIVSETILPDHVVVSQMYYHIRMTYSNLQSYSETMVCIFFTRDCSLIVVLDFVFLVI